ncbi:tetraspanin-13 isoform X2 [Patella vulgata]|uniref:tetraspanin-13 isoform X2 n=1 Tax=Patella vulgata TaxID=6465 RepID=UPI0021802FEA|nr:tetraspanin-13 isoform X2 [Patella vulgata]
MACSGFSCSKNTLTLLNILYFIVAIILIGVAAYGRVASLVTSLTLVGSVITCGVILFFIALIGLVGSIRHHQVLLFFYMIILFLLFLLQFSLACACLAVNTQQKDDLVTRGWMKASNETRDNVQKNFDCCGFLDNKLPASDNKGHPPCKELSCCKLNPSRSCCSGQPENTTNLTCPLECQACYHKLQDKIYAAFSVTGGIGLFFSFTEIIGVWITVRYRNQKDPRANPSAFL